jgi:hypothetical protein
MTFLALSIALDVDRIEIHCSSDNRKLCSGIQPFDMANIGDPSQRKRLEKSVGFTDFKSTVSLQAVAKELAAKLRSVRNHSSG